MDKNIKYHLETLALHAGQQADSESREVLLSLAQEEVRHKLRFQMELDTIMRR